MQKSTGIFTEQVNKRSVVHSAIKPDEMQKIRDGFRRGMEKKSIIWVRTDEDPLTIHEFASLLDELTENASLNETGVKIDQT